MPSATPKTLDIGIFLPIVSQIMRIVSFVLISFAGKRWMAHIHRRPALQTLLRFELQGREAG